MPPPSSEAIYEETLAVFDEQASPFEPLTTPEIADELDCGRRTAYNRLDTLVDRGEVETKKVGSGARVWWRQPAEQPTMGARNIIEGRHDEAERELLHKTTRSIAQSATFDKGLQAALQDICEATDWAYAEAWIPAEEGKLRRAEADYYTGDFAEFAEFSKGCTFAHGEGLPGRVWASGEFEWAANLPSGLRGEFLRLDEALSVGLNSTLGVPVVADDEVVAVLTFFMREAREIDDRLVKQVSSVAAELGELLTRRQVEKRLKRERDLVERVLETIPVGLDVLSSHGEVVRANKRAAEILGIIKDDPEADSYVEEERRIYDPDGDPVPPQDRPYAHVFETGEPILDWQCQIENPDGERRWLLVNATPLTDEDGEVEWVVTSGEDITQLKEQARRLERQRDDLKTELDEVFDRIRDGFFGLDTRLRFTHVNERAADLLDKSAGELVGERIWDAFVPGPKAKAAFDEALETQEPATFEEFSEPLDTWFENHVYPSESGLSVYLRDITDRVERERELRQYATIVETVDDGVYALDADEQFTMVNEALCTLTGYNREELLEAHPTLINSTAVNESANRISEQITEGEVNSGTLEFDIERADGTTVPVESRFTHYDTKEGTGARCGVVRDISERKERKRRYEAIFNQTFQFTGLMEPDGTLIEANETALEFGGVDREEVVGEKVWDTYWFQHGDAAEHARAAVERARGGELVRKELNVQGADRVATIDFSVKPVTDEQGEVVLVIPEGRDITERKEAEEALSESEARLDAFVTATSGVVYRMSPDWSEMYSLVGQEFIFDTDEPRETWLEEYIPADERPRVQAAIDEAIETKRMFELEHQVLQVDGTRGWTHSRAVPMLSDDDELVEWFGTATDITDRKQRERQLEEYRRWNETLVENFPAGVVALVNEDLRFLTFAGAPQGVTNMTRTDFEGELVRDVLPQQIADVVVPGYEAALDGEASEFEETVDNQVYHYNFVPVRDDDGRVFAVTAMSQDITERKQRERNLERYERIVETVRDGVYALDSDDRFVLVNQAFCDLVEYDRETLLGAHPTLINSQAVNDTANDLQAKIQAGERDVGVVEAEFETATGETILVEGRITPFEYADGRVGRCGVARDVTEQKRREEELTALNRLNRVFQEVTDAIIESSSREAIEQTITDQLTNSDSYEYAWIGHLDRHGEKIVPQIAGMDEAGLSEVTLSTSTDDPTSHGPVAKAIRTGEVQVTYDNTADPVFDQWKQSQDIRHQAVISVSIPLTHEERVHGVLNLYTVRENAFDENERRIIRRISDVVGHAINAIERKQALLEDRVHEITFRSHRFAEIFTETAGDESFTVSLEKFVALPDDQSIAYYSLDGLDPAVFIDVIETYNPNAEYHVTDDDGSRARVEVEQSNLTLAVELAKYNSWIVDGTLQNGEFQIRVQVPQHAHVREVKDVVTEVYPDVEVVAQTEVERESAHLSDIFSDLDDHLTERQRTTLEVAYYSGYFDWPRAITGEELAERLDVTQGTISHHLRHGEQKLLSAFFDSTA